MSLAADLKEDHEAKTLEFFAAVRVSDGHPGYLLVERRESPDRILRARDDDRLIGAEITRIVDAQDAESLNRDAYLAATIREVLQPYGVGGRVCLGGGRFPDTSPEGCRRLANALQREISIAGGLQGFVEASAPEGWLFGDTLFLFTPIPDETSWSCWSGYVSPPRRLRAPPEELDARLLVASEKKAEKAKQYAWSGPLILLIRNGYQAHRPSAAVASKVRAICARAFEEAWLVNRKYYTEDIAPAEPCLVRLA